MCQPVLEVAKHGMPNASRSVQARPMQQPMMPENYRPSATGDLDRRNRTLHFMAKRVETLWLVVVGERLGKWCDQPVASRPHYEGAIIRAHFIQIHHASDLEEMGVAMSFDAALVPGLGKNRIQPAEYW